MNINITTRWIIVFCALCYMISPSPTVRPAHAQQPPDGPSATNAPDAETAILSIPAAAFVSAQLDADYENHGRHILHNETTHQRFHASVQLPHGATVTRVSACFYGHVGTVGPRLYLYHYVGDFSAVEMAEVSTKVGDDDGYRIYSDSTIIDPVISTFYGYYTVEYGIPGQTPGAIWGCGATIEYIKPASASHYYPIAAGSFRPMEDGYNSGVNSSVDTLSHNSRPGGGNGAYLAPVNLPHGAVVTGVAMTYTDQQDDHTITAYLQRALAGNPASYSSMASVASTVAGDGLTIESNAISNATIDNNYMYWILVDLPYVGALNRIELHGVEVIYTPPASPPTNFRLSNADFTGFHDGFDFENHARWLYHLHSEGGGSATGTYVAPLYLPDHTRITNLWATIYDASASQSALAKLARTHLGSGTNEVIATITSAGSGGYSVYNATWLGENSIVDNSRYAYYVYWVLPVSTSTNFEAPGADDVVGVSMKVDYQYLVETYLPLALR